MYNIVKKSLHYKILFLFIGLMSLGVAISILWEVKHKERELIDEKLRSSKFLAQPVMTAIYEDMLEERADLARHLVNTLDNIEGIELTIIRSNGVEAAFKDYKTINAVKKEYGSIKPEWITDHPNERDNVAYGVGTAEFKKAYADFKNNWKMGAVHYINSTGPQPMLTYLRPIEKKAKCSTCHSAEGARGILMIRTPLNEMYATLSKTRDQWIGYGVFAITLGSVLMSLVVSGSITGPIRKTMQVIKRITEGKGAISERVRVSSSDEIGYLATAFNNMLDTLEKREEENKKLFDLVAKSREEWIATFDAIQDLISIQDRDCRILKVNKALAKKYNVEPEDIIGKRCHEVFYNRCEPHAFCPHNKTLATAEASDVEVSDMTIDGTYKFTTYPVFNENGEVWATVHIARDITQDKLLREQLLHSEKLSSVGKLVAGIAHELNNPLMGIMGFSQILMDMPGDKKLDDIKEKLGKIYHESLRTARIVQNLLTFARSRKTEREYIDLNEVVRHTVDLREYSLKANNISVALELDRSPLKSMVDIYQMQQVFINIINNAEDAMVAANGKGRLIIKTRKVRARVEVTFRDDGPGIPRENIHRIFDPFFTTKDVGKGTGLGLSISHGIITEHGGTIGITSPEGGGTLVTIVIPVVESDQWAEVKKAIDSGGTARNAHYGKNALVVDDERSIRDAIAEILANEGFKVDTARDGREALELMENRKYSIVLTDVRMPGVSGTDLYSAISNKYPHLLGKVIVLTGDVFSAEIKDFLARNNCPHILKPFALKDLLELINKVLDAKTA